MLITILLFIYSLYLVSRVKYNKKKLQQDIKDLKSIFAQVKTHPDIENIEKLYGLLYNTTQYIESSGRNDKEQVDEIKKIHHELKQKLTEAFMSNK